MRASLDTHILIGWLDQSARLSPAQQEVLSRADPDSPLLVSDITLWEIATLCSLGRIQLSMPLRDWLDKAVAPPLVRRQGISPAVAADMAAPPTASSWPPPGYWVPRC